MAKKVNKTEKPRKQVNYAQVFAIKEKYQKQIQELCPQANTKSGIYVYTRVSAENVRFFYCGQAKCLIERLCSHMTGYSHIDLSIKKWGLYNAEKNPYGWKIHILEYTKDLDERERYWIKQYLDAGFQTRNKNLGGQNSGKVGLEDNKPSKTYRDGIVQGTKNTTEKVRVYFDKYLDATIKLPSNKTKERKLQEFKQFLEGNDEGGND